MTGNERRAKIISILRNRETPISGTVLAKQLSVSRQVIVQDIALLRANGFPVLSTNLGYVLSQTLEVKRVVKVLHTDADVLKELQLVVDLGGKVEDVFVYHKAYGVIRADMKIRSRKDALEFTEKINSGKSSLLMHTTSGYHYHTISAENEETLDLIFETLRQKGFLAPLQDYEPFHFNN